MANSIVFQDSAEQLKTAVYGYNSSNGSYVPLKVNSSGELDIIVGTISSISHGTISSLTSGTIRSLTSGTLSKVTSLTSGTIRSLTSGTLSKVTSLTSGTIKSLTSGTLSKVTSLTSGTIRSLTSGTLSMVTSLTSGTIRSLTSGTLSKVTSLTSGTIRSLTSGTLSKVTSLTGGTITSLSHGTANITIINRAFTASYYATVAVTATAMSGFIDISKYQDTSWYVRNITSSSTRTVNVQLVATPSYTDLTNYPIALIKETTTVNRAPKAITNSNYMKYIAAYITNTSATTQNIKIVFNGRC